MSSELDGSNLVEQNQEYSTTGISIAELSFKSLKQSSLVL